MDIFESFDKKKLVNKFQFYYDEKLDLKPYQSIFGKFLHDHLVVPFLSQLIRRICQQLCIPKKCIHRSPLKNSCIKPFPGISLSNMNINKFYKIQYTYLQCISISLDQENKVLKFNTCIIIMNPNERRSSIPDSSFRLSCMVIKVLNGIHAVFYQFPFEPSSCFFFRSSSLGRVNIRLLLSLIS